MARLLALIFLAGAGLFCGYAIGQRPHGEHWAWMRRSTNIEDRRQDLDALGRGLDDTIRIAQRAAETAAMTSVKPKPKAK